MFSDMFRIVQNCAAMTEHRVTRQRAQHSLANELRPIFHLWRLDFLAVKQVSFHTESESGTQRAGLQDYVGFPIQLICFKPYSLFMILCQFKFVKLRMRPCFQYFCLNIKTQICILDSDQALKAPMQWIIDNDALARNLSYQRQKIHPQVYYADTQCRGQCFYFPRGIIMDEVSPTAGGEIKLPKITLCGEVSPPDKCGWARNL